MKKNKLLAVLLCAALVMMSLTGFAFAEAVPEEGAFAQWTPDAPALTALIDYVAAVTDPSSPDFIPEADRIAVFDLDGTLMCETCPFCFEYMVFADYALKHADAMPEDVLAVAQEIVDATGKAKPDGMSTRQAAAAAIAYKGMTTDELAQVVSDFKGSQAWGFTGMTRGEAWYKPMLELFEMLQANGFEAYVVTATERNIVREIIKGTLDIPPSHVIGTEYGYVATNQGDAADTDYTFQAEDEVVFDGNYFGENAKTSKVDAIVREIGQKPVLAFGNSSGDLAMEIYTISNNPYRSAAYMVVADDGEREYADADGAADKKSSYESMGIGVISMRDDFATIYGDGVKKADVIQPAEEAEAVAAPAASDPEPAQEEVSDADPAQEEVSDQCDVQYVLFLGTNDKDTNKPVFTQAEAMEKARQILMARFGGYTIQEAFGGWIGDDDTQYQEYTLVIYLSDTTEDAVHAAADELLATFNQNSVLIQKNPTSTEFYSAQG